MAFLPPNQQRSSTEGKKNRNVRNYFVKGTGINKATRAVFSSIHHVSQQINK